MLLAYREEKLKGFFSLEIGCAKELGRYFGSSFYCRDGGELVFGTGLVIWSHGFTLEVIE